MGPRGFCNCWQRKASNGFLAKTLMEMAILAKASRKTLKVVIVPMTGGQ